jgi:PleD family two-component response regulator
MNTELLSCRSDTENASRATRILVVDDEPTVIQVLSRFLTREGYQAVSAINGQEALEKIQQEVPDVLLLDVKMPVLDGLSVCRAMRADFRTRGLPIILLTGNGRLEDRLQGYKTGADDFLTKPFNLDELKIRIEGALHRRQWDQGTHPLTHLPGSPGIEEEVRRRLGLGAPFAFAYIDIDYFKAFNDVYGYEAGDRVIKEVADSLIRSSIESAARTGFPGHIGGDDFVLIAPIETMKDMLPEIIKRFDTKRFAHYRPEDIQRGAVLCKNRRGQDQEFPLIALSIAVVSTQTRRISHYARLAGIASELKRFVKSQDHGGKSLAIWDRRTDPETPHE